MKLRIKWYGGRTQLLLADDQSSFGNLEYAVSKLCGLVAGSFGLSLNGRDVLRYDERDSVSEAGIRSGDLLTVILKDGEEPPPQANAEPQPLEVRASHERSVGPPCPEQHCEVGSDNGPRIRDPAVAVAPSQELFTEAADKTALEGSTTSVGSRAGLEPESLDAACAPLKDKFSDIIAHPADNSIRNGWPLTSDTRTADEGKDASEARDSNRYLREPILVSETTTECLPQNLTAAISHLMSGTEATAFDLLFAALHAVMVESGYHPPSVHDSQAAKLPDAWKTLYGYKVAYAHSSVDNAVFHMMGVPMGSRTLIVRALMGCKSLAVLQLCTDDYVCSTRSDPRMLYKNLGRLSRYFKDSFSHRLLPLLEQSLGLPQRLPDLVRMPDELLLHMLAYLGVPCLIAIGSTCRALRRLYREPALWRRHYVARYGVPREVSLAHDWYLRYKSKHEEERRFHEAAAMMRADEYVLLEPPRLRLPIVGGDYDLFPPIGVVPPNNAAHWLRHMQPRHF